MPARTVDAERLSIVLRGAVQGVGFRPMVYRLAEKLGVAGWVRNSAAGLEIEIEGSAQQLADFIRDLACERPRGAAVTMQDVSRVAPTGAASFQILPSHGTASRTAAVLPDLATCPACLHELFDPADRRFDYPFTNCTLCGPRYTIVVDIPYDRHHTTMGGFRLCPECRREYASVHDRRFHAQPIACPNCGPHLWSVPTPEGATPLAHAAAALGRGEIVALKGIGGFQLLVDALNGAAVRRLRDRKGRDAKPFAVLMASIERVREYCVVSAAEEELLRSAAAPIVLLRPAGGCRLAPEVRTASPYVGVMLPCSPLHHLLMQAHLGPVVATSGNRSDDPIAVDNDEACARLGAIADVFVLHDRPIARPCDDSVTRITGDRRQIIRRARGYAPLPVTVPRDLAPVLAVGGHQKNTVAIALGRQVFLSQHIGDLDSPDSRAAFERAIDDLCRLYRFEPTAVACDLHPDYWSTRWALASGLPVTQVQHHHAHVAACAAEHGIEGSYLGVAWDGTGVGLDRTLWGGEFFAVRDSQFERVAQLRPFRLPGGEAAAVDCRRSAASLVWDTWGPLGAEPWTDPGVNVLLERGSHAPWSSSVGRLFDAVACLSGVADRNRFEGHAAMCLEGAIGNLRTTDSYVIVDQGGIGDWGSLIETLLLDRQAEIPVAEIAAKFHNALAAWIVAVARETQLARVVLSGGVFQNAYLTERARTLLERDGFDVFSHERVPANDGGLSLGQAVLAGLQLAR